MQQVLRQRTHHSDPHDQTGAPVWGRPLSRDHPEEEVQDPEVPKQSQGGERRRGEGRRRKEKETRQTERGGGRGAARFVEMIRFIHCFKLTHKLICSPPPPCWFSRDRLQDAAVEQLDGLYQTVRGGHPGAFHECEEKSERCGRGRLQGPQGDPRLQRSSLLGGATEPQRTGARSCKKKQTKIVDWIKKIVGMNSLCTGKRGEAEMWWDDDVEEKGGN